MDSNDAQIKREESVVPETTAAPQNEESMHGPVSALGSELPTDQSAPGPIPGTLEQSNQDQKVFKRETKTDVASNTPDDPVEISVSKPITDSVQAAPSNQQMSRVPEKEIHSQTSGNEAQNEKLKRIALDLNQIFTSEVAELENFLNTYENKSTVLAPGRRDDKRILQAQLAQRTPSPKTQRSERNFELPNSSSFHPVNESKEDDENYVNEPDHRLSRQDYSQVYERRAEQRIGQNRSMHVRKLDLNREPTNDRELPPYEYQDFAPDRGRSYEQHRNRDDYPPKEDLLGKLNRRIQKSPFDPIENNASGKYDEKPIVANTKTFEQLLDQELKKVDNPETSGGGERPIDDGPEQARRKQQKQAFLKKNEGKNIANQIVVVQKDKKEVHFEPRLPENMPGRDRGESRTLNKNAANAKSKKAIASEREMEALRDSREAAGPTTKSLMSEINKLFDNFETEMNADSAEEKAEIQTESHSHEQNPLIELKDEHVVNTLIIDEAARLGAAGEQKEQQAQSPNLPYVQKQNFDSVEIKPEQQHMPNNEVKTSIDSKNKALVENSGQQKREQLKVVKIDNFLEEAKRILDHKVAELNASIHTQKSLQNQLRAQLAEVAKKEQLLERDRAEFDRARDEEMRRLEEMKSLEQRRLKRDQLTAQRNQKLPEKQTSKKEKEELEQLQKSIKVMEDEFLSKEKRMRLLTEKQKKQIDQQSEEILELRSRLNQLEKQGSTGAVLGLKIGRSESKVEFSKKEADRTPLSKIPEEGSGNGGGAAARYSGLPKSGSLDRLEKRRATEGGASSGIGNSGQHTSIKAAATSSQQETSPTDNISSRKGGDQDQQSKTQQTPASNQPSTKPVKQPPAIQNIYQSFENKPPRDKALKSYSDPEQYRYNTNKFYKMYIDNLAEPRKLIKHTPLGDGKVQNIYDNNVQEVIFPNGAKRETFPNGYSIVHFVNNDIKQILPDGGIIYYYKEHDTTQITNQKNGVDVSSPGLSFLKLAGRVS